MLINFSVPKNPAQLIIAHNVLMIALHYVRLVLTNMSSLQANNVINYLVKFLIVPNVNQMISLNAKFVHPNMSYLVLNNVTKCLAKLLIVINVN